jgi:hypothetical protein
MFMIRNYFVLPVPGGCRHSADIFRKRIFMAGIVSIHSHIRHESLVSGISNLVFNGVIAWLLLRSGSKLTLGGENNYAVDIAATAFILPFIVALIVIPLNRRKLAAGKAPGVKLDRRLPLQAFLLRFPKGLGWQACWIALLAAVVFTPLTLAILWALDVQEFTPTAYAVFKGCWAGLLAATITGPLLMLALQEESP